MKKLLIIEDDPIVSHIYRNRLEKEGYQVEVATDGQTGYYRIYDLKPDVLLLDLMLPKMNGIELLKKIRAVRDYETLPILVFTNAYVANMIHEAFSAGATAVYNKSSVTPRQIIDVLNTIMISGTAAISQGPNGSTNPNPSGNVQPASPSAEPAPEKAVTSVLKGADDEAFQADLLKNFLKSMPGWVNDIRKSLQDVSKSPDESGRTTQVDALYRKVRTFASNAAMSGLPCVAKLSAAVEALVKEIVEKPKNVTPSTLRTTAHAVDCLSEIAQLPIPGDLADNPPIEILVVDDEMLSRRAIVYAMEKAYLKTVAVESPEEALHHTDARHFDLIFSDVHMPGMDGFQLCQKLRQGSLNKSTPIVFVTSTADFQAKAQSTLHGASDLIAKPFMFIELTVKALTFALRHRTEAFKREKQTAERPDSTCSPEPAELIM